MSATNLREQANRIKCILGVCHALARKIKYKKILRSTLKFYKSTFLI